MLWGDSTTLGLPGGGGSGGGGALEGGGPPREVCRGDWCATGGAAAAATAEEPGMYGLRGRSPSKLLTGTVGGGGGPLLTGGGSCAGVPGAECRIGGVCTMVMSLRCGGGTTDDAKPVAAWELIGDMVVAGTGKGSGGGGGGTSDSQRPLIFSFSATRRKLWNESWETLACPK